MSEYSDDLERSIRVLREDIRVLRENIRILYLDTQISREKIQSLQEKILLSQERVNHYEKELIKLSGAEAKFEAIIKLKEAKEGLDDFKIQLEVEKKKLTESQDGLKELEIQLEIKERKLTELENQRQNQELNPDPENKPSQTNVKAAIVNFFDQQNESLQLGIGCFFTETHLICTYYQGMANVKETIRVEFEGGSYLAKKCWTKTNLDIHIYEITDQHFHTSNFLEIESDYTFLAQDTTEGAALIDHSFYCFGFSDSKENETFVTYKNPTYETEELIRFSCNLGHIHRDSSKQVLFSPLINKETDKAVGLIISEDQRDNSVLVVPMKAIPYNLDPRKRQQLKAQRKICVDILQHHLIKHPSERHYQIVLEAIDGLKKSQEGETVNLPNDLSEEQSFQKEDFILALAEVMKGAGGAEGYIKAHNSLLSELVKVVFESCDQSKWRFYLFYLFLYYLRRTKRELIGDASIDSFLMAFRKGGKTARYFTQTNDPSQIIECLLHQGEIDPSLLWLIKEKGNVKFENYYFHEQNKAKPRNCHDLHRWSKWDIFTELDDLSRFCSDLKRKRAEIEANNGGRGMILESEYMAKTLGAFRHQETAAREKVAPKLRFNELLRQFEEKSTASSGFSWAHQGHLFVQALTLLYQHEPKLAYKTAFS